jgi:hypothetical protein
MIAGEEVFVFVPAENNARRSTSAASVILSSGINCSI